LARYLPRLIAAHHDDAGHVSKGIVVFDTLWVAGYIGTDPKNGMEPADIGQEIKCCTMSDKRRIPAFPRKKI
jgi:hypothetical protein